MRKPKLSIDEQIEHMKSKGIKFEIITEDASKIFLTDNTYYFKIKAYAKNYDKYVFTEKAGQYENLEFAYLQELSTIDMHLRHFIIKMSLDIEHAAKVNLLNDFNKSSDNGYDIIMKLFAENTDMEKNIRTKKDNSFCNDLVTKLLQEDFAIWNVIEVLSFSEFLKLYELFYREYPECLTGKNLYYPLKSVRKLRNAAAHSNCLLNSLKKPYSGEIKTNDKVNSFVSKIPNVHKLSRINNMSNQVIYDFVTLLYVFDIIIKSKGVKKYTMLELNDLVSVRMIRHKEYFAKNNSIVSSYEFIKKIVDYLLTKSI